MHIHTYIHTHTHVYRIIYIYIFNYIYIYIYIYIDARSRLSNHEEECSTAQELLKYSEIDLFTHFWGIRGTDLFCTPAMSTHTHTYMLIYIARKPSL